MRPPETSLRSQGSSSPFSLAISLRIARTSRASFSGSRGSGEDGGDRGSDLRGERRLARDDPRPRQRHVLPGLRFRGLVELEGRELRRQRPLAPGGAQPQIDFVELSRLGRRGQRGDQALRQARVIDDGAERPRAVGFAGVGGKIVDHDQIEIGGRGHFARAELAHGEDGDAPAPHAAVIEREGVARPWRSSAPTRLCASAL